MHSVPGIASHTDLSNSDILPSQNVWNAVGPKIIDSNAILVFNEQQIFPAMQSANKSNELSYFIFYIHLYQS